MTVAVRVDDMKLGLDGVLGLERRSVDGIRQTTAKLEAPGGEARGSKHVSGEAIWARREIQIVYCTALTV